MQALQPGLSIPHPPRRFNRNQPRGGNAPRPIFPGRVLTVIILRRQTYLITSLVFLSNRRRPSLEGNRVIPKPGGIATIR